METLANLESFARTAEAGSFSAAARRLALSPAAVSRNVAMLERNLGVRLFHSSTRKLTLTEGGGREVALALDETIVTNDPEAMCQAALLGLGVALIAVPHAGTRQDARLRRLRRRNVPAGSSGGSFRCSASGHLTIPSPWL